MKRSPTTPKPDRIIRNWKDKGWKYQLLQRGSGDYLVLAISLTDDDWRMESGPTVKAALAAIHADADALLMMAE